MGLMLNLVNVHVREVQRRKFLKKKSHDSVPPHLPSAVHIYKYIYVYIYMYMSISVYINT